MFKTSLVIVVLSCLVVSTWARAISEDETVKEGMKSAFKTGLDFFGGAVARDDRRVPVPDYRKTKVFSHYSAAVPAPAGGGKASLSEQYRKHSFVPDVPVVIPHEHPVISGKMSAADAAARYVPHAPLQYTTDQMFNTGKSG